MATIVSVLGEKLGPWKNLLCSVGVFYAAKVAVTFTWKAVGVVRGYFLSRLRPLDIGYFGGWAVVTGAADGIGRAYSRKLASCGYNIVLVDRSHGNLQLTADAIVQEYGVEVRMVQIEFGADQSVYDRLERHLTDIDIGILVNNVGLTYDYPDFFLKISHQMLWKLIHVNVAATTFMTRIVLPKMVSRGCGLVINISSGAAHRPCPQLAAYTASKIYVEFLSQALHFEYRHLGIVVQCVSPMLVHTRPHRNLHTGFFLPPAEQFVDHAICTVGRQTQTAGYWPHALQVGFLGMLPTPLFNYFANHANNAMRKHAMERRQVQGNTPVGSPANRPKQQLTSPLPDGTQ